VNCPGLRRAVERAHRLGERRLRVEVTGIRRHLDGGADERLRGGPARPEDLVAPL
jgi:hypothetical protein